MILWKNYPKIIILSPSLPRFNPFFGVLLTTSPRTSVLTRSPISGEMSEPNCCNVVKNLFNLLSCLAPQAGGSCWLDEFVTEGGEGVPPFIRPLFIGECGLGIPAKY